MERSWKSRTQKRIDNTLGVIHAGDKKVKRTREASLDTFEAYRKGKQYDHLLPWDTGSGPSDDYVSIRKRKPRIIYPLASRIANTVAGKLLGRHCFPAITSETDPGLTQYVAAVVKTSRAKVVLVDAMKDMAILGSAFVRFFVAGPYLKMEVYNPNHVYPQFDIGGELSFVRIQYTWFDKDDKDENGDPREKWFRMDLGRDVDIMYDAPLVQNNSEPVFEPIEVAEHGFGFVQGEWFRTSESRDTPDGQSLIAPVLPFFDALNYSLSQADQAVAYSHEPQLGINGMDEAEVTELIKSATKAWNLGREGKAGFIEANLSGVEAGTELRSRMALHIQEITRIVLLDPEKALGAAQSGKAMEILHGPLVELVDELRAQVEDRVRNLVLKMSAALLILRQRGVEEVMQFPAGWKPTAMDLVLAWPPIFPPTMEDLQKKVQVASSASSGSLISRETLTGWLAKDFGVEDVEAEVAKVAAQPVINPFGGF